MKRTPLVPQRDDLGAERIRKIIAHSDAQGSAWRDVRVADLVALLAERDRLAGRPR